MLYSAKAFGDIFSELRKHKGYSIEELATLSSVSKRTLQHIEHGNHLAKLDTLMLLSFYLDTNLVEVLLSCKEEREAILDDLLHHFSEDMSQYCYEHIPDYIAKLYDLYSSKRYDKSLVEDAMFFNTLESSIFWLRGIDASCNRKEFQRAEIYLITGLSIRHNTLTLETITDYDLNNLEVSLLNALVSNRIRFCHFDLCHYLLQYARSQYEQHKVYDLQLSSGLLLNLGQLYLHEYNYIYAKKTAEEALNLFDRYTSTPYRCHFILMLSLCNYKLGITHSYESIYDALILFRLDDKEHLIPYIKERLKNHHHLMIEDHTTYFLPR